ncbi:Ni/Fe-hydrogenase cytochrome b subunit [Denitromonas iodatirespirans]|uniref:Ni/Fe-hydrogenase cytochrome b subunit n=1 Tax=Denitromonas iodatirespirans TaxID=2795389 RepID=A0A944D8E0_DENI1|nr:Ni/Fe-hydrogenase cytochrome b subunit [Denitromonas iodatirespirans]MBT0959807.1 Ni/Fe-hydrogenase cytochrome b subunit [Denitromonas iodatirespirans]
MTKHAHAAPAPVGGRLLSPVTFVLGVLILAALAILAVRFVYGLGTVTNLNDGYPWGIWVVADVVIGSAFACGGFSVAMLVYIFNKGEYHPLVRPALLASLFGYTLAGVGVLFDLGRWWNFWHILAPGYASPNSVMFEVAACISLYIVVMWIEFSPTFFEKWGMKDARRKVNKAMFFFIALGTVLPMMHQSSLGSLLVVFGTQIHPLWQSIVLPLIFLISAITMGYAVVLFESCLAAAGYRRTIEMHLLTPLSKIMLGMLGVFLAVRFGDLIVRGALGYAFEGSVQAAMFWLETACFVAPFVLLRAQAARRNPARLFVAGALLMLGGVLLRINAFLVGYDTGEGWSYFPSVPEMLVTFGMFAIEILAYIVITRRFPVLPREDAVHGAH